MERKHITITLKFDRVIEERSKSIKLQMTFKIDNNEYYWGFWLPKHNTMIDSENRVIIPIHLLSSMKLSLHHHTFPEVRYNAKFYKYKIKFIKA